MEAHPLKLPMRVRVCGVASKPELNGQLGLALSWDRSTARYAVRLDSFARLALLADRVEPLHDYEEESGGIVSVNGLSFCAMHRVETCDACRLDFAVPNRLLQLGHDPLSPSCAKAMLRAERQVAAERDACKPPLSAPPPKAAA
jgi:hypothetical protein